jgi:hypothetical protein
VCKSNLPVFIISTQKFDRENLELKYVDSLVETITDYKTVTETPLLKTTTTTITQSQHTHTHTVVVGCSDVGI